MEEVMKTKIPKQISNNEKEILHRRSPEQIVMGLISDGFKAKILRIKENKDGSESWKVVLKK